MWHKFFNCFVKITAFPLYLIACRSKILYEDKRIQSRRIRGKAVIISNHKSVWDVGFMLFLFPLRTLRCVIAEIMYTKSKIFSFFLNSLGGIKVDRNAHDFSFVEKSCKILEKGGVVEIYPESRLPRPHEKDILEFKPSAAYIAMMSGAPIIPVYTNGSYFSKTRTRAIIGKPIDVTAMYDSALSEQDNLKNITENLRDKVVELKNELDNRTKEAPKRK